MKSHFFFCLFLFSLFSQGSGNCLRSQTILNKDTLYNLSVNANDSVIIHYIGCSGFFIRKGNNVVLIDPYFSNKKASTYLFGSLTNKSTVSTEIKSLINSAFLQVTGDSLDRSGIIKTLLITHGHVDHYGDVPYLFQSGYLNKDTIKIIGNTTVQCYLNGDEIPEKNIIKPVEESASFKSNGGKWIYVNNKIRVLPIIGGHAPHLRILGINFYVVPKKNESASIRHKYWRQYSSGQTLCYLIDFLNDDKSINFRVYIKSSASSFPYGFPTQEVSDQHPVDIAMLCVASFNNVRNYPEDIVSFLKPRHIIACHWEQFLKSSLTELKKKPETAPIANVNKFFKRLDKVIFDLNSGISHVRPNVNTTIKYFYSNTQR